MDFNNRRTSTLLFLGIGILFVGVILLQYYTVDTSDSYIRQISLIREQKDLNFRSSPSSPIKESERAKFEGLAYFPPDESYVVQAELIPAESQETLLLMTTQGEDYKVIRAGMLQFELQGLTHQLVVYRYLDPANPDFFVPFRDLTSGGETYGGGRYLDVPSAEGNLTLDFNQAYHPYCVYNEEYVCPLPPPENKLLIEVRAGERLGE